MILRKSYKKFYIFSILLSLILLFSVSISVEASVPSNPPTTPPNASTAKAPETDTTSSATINDPSAGSGNTVGVGVFSIDEDDLLDRADVPFFYRLSCIIGMALPIAGIFIILREQQSHGASLLLVAEVICLFYNGVYFLFVSAENQKQSIAITKTVYLAEVLFFFFYIIFIYEYMGIKSKILPGIYGLAIMIAIFILWDNRYSALLFTNFDFRVSEQGDGKVSTLSYQNGTLFFACYDLLLFILGFLFFYMLVKRIKCKVKFEKRNYSRLLISHLIIIFAMISDETITETFSIIPLLSALSVFYLLIGVVKGNFLGIAERARNLVFEQINDAFITVNKDFEFLDANIYARELFPELKELHEGEMLPESVMKSFKTYYVDDNDIANGFNAKKINDHYYRTMITDLSGITPDEYVSERKKIETRRDYILTILRGIKVFGKKREEAISNKIETSFDARIQKLSNKNAKIEGYNLLLLDVTDQYELFCEAEEERENALSAAQAKSDFLSNMSHEIRTPMNAIVGMTEIIMREDLSPEIRSYLSNIKNSGDALLSIINDILDFSKIESGKLEIIDDDYEPMSMLSDLSMIFLNRIGERPIELIYDIDPALPHLLYGDAIRIRQVITNIANNAIKFTEHGFVKLSLRCEEVPEKANDDSKKIHLIFSVADSGQGIKEEDMDKLFGSFTQVDTRKNRTKEGTGLGLAISKSLVERMGGHISVSSVYGEGSTFTFDIYQEIKDPRPAAHIKEEYKNQTVCCNFSSEFVSENFKKLCLDYNIKLIDTAQIFQGGESCDIFFCDNITHGYFSALLENSGHKIQHIILRNPMTEIDDSSENSINKPLFSLNFCQILNHEKITSFETHKETIDFIAPEAKILIVDDNEMNLKVAKGLLAPLQIQIDTAMSGMEALDMISDFSYDIIFMDHMMPEMDGIETTKLIRARESEYMKTVPIIALTANAVSGAKEEFLANGMDDFVPKPIEMNTICSKIKAYLPREKVTKQKVEIDIAPKEDISEFEKIPNLDAEKGIKNSGGLDLFRQFLGDYEKLIDMKSQKVLDLMETGDIKDYTIEVHALKSTSRTIGLMSLGDKFEHLEKLGDAGDTEHINAETAEIIEEYKALKSYLAPYAISDDDGSKKEATTDEIKEILDRIKDCTNDFDIDGTDAAFKELKSIKLPTEIESKMTDLEALITDIAMDDIINEVEEIEKLL